MVITDLDGTLLNSDRRVSETDIETLSRLGEEKIVRVIATGRSQFSITRVIPDDFPVDFVITSSGAGILEWKSKRIILKESLAAEIVTRVAEQLISSQLDFMIQKPVPDNHYFSYYHSGTPNPDFFRRLSHYEEFALPLDPGEVQELAASQIIVITPPGINHYSRLQADLAGLNVVRTTSPLDHRSMWIEVFPGNVSKSNAAMYLCDLAGCSVSEVMSVGNDYNDLDLLEWSPVSFVVDNAPRVLREMFSVVASHNENGFSEAVSSSFMVQ